MALVGETLNEAWTTVVASLEVARQPSQEAGEAEHALEMVPSPVIIPTDPAITRRRPQGGGRKAGRSRPAMGRADQAAELPASENGHSMGMPACNQRVPQGPVSRIRRQLDAEFLDPRRMRWHRFGLGNTGIGQARPGPPPVPSVAAGQSPGSSRPMRRAPSCSRQAAAGRIEKGEFLADPATGRAPAVELVLRQDGGDARHCRLAAPGAADPGPCHGARISCGKYCSEESGMTWQG